MSAALGIAEERWSSLLYAMELGNVVPIVGRSLSLVDVDAAPPVPLQRAAVQAMARELGITSIADNVGLADLYRRMVENSELDVETFHPILKRVLTSFKPHLDPLRKLAEITHFRLYLSTAFDGYLGQAVRELRGDQGKSVTIHTFAPGYENPQQAIVRAGEVCVYNLLGGLNTYPNWAVTMEEMVEFVLGMHGEKYRPDQLFAALKDKHLLAIGCQIPDWLGRFFLRALRNDRISKQSGVTHLVEDAADADAALGHYLQSFSKKALVVPGNAMAFVDELNRRWKAHVGNTPPSLERSEPATGDPPPDRAAKVFLSYSHADGNEAQRLYDYLLEQGIDVWKDNRHDALTKGGNWDHEINRQIADCACFVPIISRQTIQISQSYFWKEWNLALDRSASMNKLTRRFIFPVLCTGDVNVPEQFRDRQCTLLSDEGERAALARALSDEQRRLRKEARWGGAA